MSIRACSTWMVVLALTAPAAAAEAPLIPPGEKEPLFRLEAEGPTSFVTALAFSPEGNTLYAAGWDKVVRVWNRDPQTGRFVLDRAAYRVPLGPGIAGAINAIALSPDGTWLAVGGMGVMREGAGFRELGVVRPKISLSDAAREDEGTIYLFHTRTRTVRPLRGHRGPILSLAFAPARPDKPALLVSAGLEWVAQTSAYAGTVRLWNVLDGTAVARLPKNLPFQPVRPGLAVQHSGKELKQVHVALACADGLFRLWDVERGVLREQEQGRNNLAVAALPGSTQFLAGSTGKLQVWSASPTGEPRPEERRQVAFPTAKEVYALPVALTLFSAQANDKPDHAAVIVQLRGPEEGHWLYLLDLDPANFGAVRARLPLRLGSAQQPVMAVVARGRYLAVAGNPEHEIAVFSLADLLRNRVQAQTLRSTGTTVQEVAFVTKGPDTGLLLREKSPPPSEQPPRELIFDFRQRLLSTDRIGWQTSAPPLDGWKVQVALAEDKKEHRVSVSRGEQRVGVIRLNPNQVVTRSALLPPGPFRVPILALAVYELGEPLLLLYNAESGELIRQLTGHANYIRALAFAGDGKLLASAGEDQTVCIWSLTDLDQHLGQHGLVRGVAVQEKAGVLVVVELDAAQMAPKNQNQLHLGDQILGLADGERTIALTSSRAFYDALAPQAPGTSVALRVQDASGQRRTVRFELGQAVDERKPLVSLFVTRGTKPEARDWLGWNPLGFYESSSPRAERNFGWHFNRGEPSAPTAFAAAEEYRKDHYREGLLKHLVAQGSLGPALKAWETEFKRQPLPPPDLSLWLEDEGGPVKQVDGQGRVLVGQPGITLKLGIDNFPLDRIDQVEWQFDTAAERKFEQATGRDWGAALASLAWTRGEHRLRARLRTREEDPRTYVQELTLHYQPQPPTILCAAPALQVVAKPEFTLRAQVRPGPADRDIGAQLLHRHQSKVLLTQELAMSPRRDIVVERQFQLQPGENLLELVAVNSDAPRPAAEAETDRLILLVVYSPPKEVPPPSIALEKIVWKLDTGENAEQVLKPGQPLVVPTPRVRLVGQITAADKLIQAVWAKEKDGSRHALHGLDPQKNTFAIAEDLELVPGPQTVRVLAKAAASPEANAAVTLDYRPRLPELVLTRPEPILYEGEDKPEIRLQGRLLPPRDRQPYKAVVRINGQDRTPVVDEQTQLLTATLPLEPGENRIQVRLSNAWQMTTASEELHVRYARPPRVSGWEGAAQSEQPLVELVARVDSALPLLPQAVEAEVNGRPITTTEVIAPDKAPEARGWRVRLKEVALDKGKNEVRLYVRNADARCRKAGVFAVTYTPVQPPPPPEVEILQPRVDTKMIDPDLKVRFRFRSASPLLKVELFREGRTPLRRVVDVSKLQPDAKGWYETEETVALVPQENLLRVQVTSKGGERSAAVTVNYLQFPVRLAVDRLVPRGQDGPALVPEIGPNGTLTFAPTPQGRLWLEGRVMWDQENDEQLRRANEVRVFVNGFAQLPGELKPAADNQRERRFRAPILLNHAVGNRIEIDLPALKQECGNRRDFAVDCARPLAGQRLHVLIISAGERDDQKLKEQVLHAVQSPAFNQITIHGCLTGYVSARMIFTQLHNIQDRIQSLKRNDLRLAAEAYNDVVLIYFRGTEAINAQGHFFLTEAGAQRQQTPIACDSLTSRLAEILGAQVLLLDVGRGTAAVSTPSAAPGKDELEHCPDDFRVGVLRSAWHGRPQPPNEALLLTTWEEGLTRTSKFKELVSYIEARFKEEVSPKFPGLQYKEYLPPMLADLHVGLKP